MVDTDGFGLIKFLEHHLDDLVLLGGDIFSDKIGLYGQFAMLNAAVDQHGKLHFLRAAKIHQLIECGSDRAARIKDVVNEYDLLAVNVVVKFGAVHNGVGSDGRKVVAVKRDIEDPVKRLDILKAFDLVAKPFRKRNAASPDTDEIEILGTVILLDDLGREPSQSTVHCRSIHHPRLFHKIQVSCHRDRQIVTNEKFIFKRTGVFYLEVRYCINCILHTMSFFWEKIARPVMFRLDAERAHSLGMASLKAGLARPFYNDVRYDEFGEIERFGLRFANPVGLAAGFDKNAEAIGPLSSLGFGFIEAGTVTLEPQPGNARPRLFRLPEQEALINRLGFNNEGAAAIAGRLLSAERNCIVGINIGRNRHVPNEEAAENYVACLKAVHKAADYITVNVSSPNTPELRDLQAEASLVKLLEGLMQANVELGRKPLLVKVAPDLSGEEIDPIADICVGIGIDGIVATNTTVTRPGVDEGTAKKIGAGGLSGKPLKPMSLAVVRAIYRRTNGKMPIVGVGGIFSPRDAFEFISAGASLVQVYSGFIYGGPAFPRELCSGLAEMLVLRGFRTLDEAVGSAA